MSEEVAGATGFAFKQLSEGPNGDIRNWHHDRRSLVWVVAEIHNLTGIDLSMVREGVGMVGIDDHPLIQFMRTLNYGLQLTPGLGEGDSRMGPSTSGGEGWYSARFDPLFRYPGYPEDLNEWGYTIDEAVIRAALQCLQLHMWLQAEQGGSWPWVQKANEAE